MPHRRHFGAQRFDEFCNGKASLSSVGNTCPTRNEIELTAIITINMRKKCRGPFESEGNLMLFARRIKIKEKTILMPARYIKIRIGV